MTLVIIAGWRCPPKPSGGCGDNAAASAMDSLTPPSQSRTCADLVLTSNSMP